MLQATDPFKGVCRISRAKFIEILRARANPQVVAERDPGAYWDVSVAYGVDPLFLLAMFAHESSFGTAGVAVDTHSWGNTRMPTFPERLQVIGLKDGRSGKFPIFATWLDGCEATVARLTTPKWVYSGPSTNATTKQTYGPRTQIGEIFSHPSEQVWAPAGDLNNPAGYLRAMLDFMNKHGDQMTPGDVPGPIVPPVIRRIKLAIAAGHHNASGGHPDETALTGELTEAVYRRAMRAGIDVRCVTPDGPDPDDTPGDGQFTGDLSMVANKVVEWSKAGWTADVFLENHYEGVGNPNVRGAFAIYPDAAGDLDTLVRDTLGPDIARRLQQKTGLPIRTISGKVGVMSEKETGVGAQGYRLGMFRVTESLKATCTRLIVEYGAHTSPLDLAIITKPTFFEQAADAVVEAILASFGVQPVEETTRFYPETGHFVGGGFLGFINHVPNSLMMFGLPISEEFDRVGSDGKRIVTQYFERARLEWHPDLGWSWNPFHVLLGLVGVEAAEADRALYPDAFRARKKDGSLDG